MATVPVRGRTQNRTDWRRCAGAIRIGRMETGVLSANDGVDAVIQTPGKAADGQRRIRAVGGVGGTGNEHALFVRVTVTVRIFAMPNLQSRRDNHTLIPADQSGRCRQVIHEIAPRIESPIAVGVFQQPHAA